MANLISIEGFGRLYASILRFRAVNCIELKEHLYQLHSANFDTATAKLPYHVTSDLTRTEFYEHMDRNISHKPYRTVVQLYRSMEWLRMNIKMCLLISDERLSVCWLQRMMREMEDQFLDKYGVEIGDRITTYRHCEPTLSPKSEPVAIFTH